MGDFINKILSVIFYLLNFFQFKYINIRSRIFFSVRVQGKKFISIGVNSVIQRGGWLLATKIDEIDPILSIGNNCAIGDYTHIVAARKVIIEDDVLIANNVYISDNLHSYEDIKVPIINQCIKFKKEVVLKSGCWIGENVSIIGSNIGKNSVVGSNSVVVDDVPDYCVAVGIPAKVIKKFDLKSNQWVSLKL